MTEVQKSKSVNTMVEASSGILASNSFPSLSDTVLRQLGGLMEEVRKDSSQSRDVNQTYEKDIENKFTSLMLAFKTDKVTLDRRLELQKRLRDQAESNMSAELTRLKAAVELLSPLCTDSEKFELLEKVSEQVDALHKSTVRVSTTAEMNGSVKQEHRLSKAVDIMIRYVDNLTQAYNKDKTELEETRKILTDNQLTPSTSSNLQNVKRRVSIATVSRILSSLEPSCDIVLARETRGVTRVRLSSLSRKLSNTIIEAEKEEPPPTKDLSCSNGETPESVSSNSLAIARALPHATEERRAHSHPEEPESEEEATPKVQSCDLVPPESKFIFHSRRLSGQRVLITMLSESWEWLGPMNKLLDNLRQAVAGVLLVAALAVLAHSCLWG